MYDISSVLEDPLNHKILYNMVNIDTTSYINTKLSYIFCAREYSVKHKSLHIMIDIGSVSYIDTSHNIPSVPENFL